MSAMVLTTLRNRLKATMVDILSTIYATKDLIPQAQYILKLTKDEVNKIYKQSYDGSELSILMVSSLVQPDEEGRHLMEDSIDEDNLVEEDDGLTYIGYVEPIEN